jgi:hypothetical protein
MNALAFAAATDNTLLNTNAAIQPAVIVNPQDVAPIIVGKSKNAFVGKKNNAVPATYRQIFGKKTSA